MEGYLIQTIRQVYRLLVDVEVYGNPSSLAEALKKLEIAIARYEADVQGEDE